LFALVVVAGAAGAYFMSARTPAAPQNKADYANDENWVCRPGRADSCAIDLTATAIAADGTLSRQPALRTTDPQVDCFYVYPTVSRAEAPNAPLALTDEVAVVARDQFARFSTVCRPFAPLYRQTTLRALRASAIGFGDPGDHELAYRDVRDAWLSYLARDNHGRGFVLIGHSQGSRLLKRLVQQEIEGKPEQSRMVSVMLLGNAVVVPAGQDVGGDFHSVPLCRRPAQIGCVVVYSSYRASAPPPPDSRYGHDPGNGFAVACTNPAALGGGKAVLDAYFPAHFGKHDIAWTDPPAPIETPFVKLPGLISGECMHDEHGTYLSISFNGRPGDHRRNDIDGDVVVMGHVLAQWGLHIVDVNLTQGDLVKLVGIESEAFASARH
jgi:hypothetical protein